ncbi:hypothetical protein BJ741DRAFT_603487 [Chytriomyces cf. hyalinus JEL632]|nr:hypothetical protein BJ741DRAFT_603487 [Chytriomyces cf. hyalinus JEL632]
MSEEVGCVAANSRAAALTEMIDSLDRELQQIDECIARSKSMSSQQRRKGVCISQLHSSSVLSGKLPTLDQNFDQTTEASREKFFLLTAEADLYVFQNSNRDTVSDAFLSIQACSGYWHETCQSWVLQVIGSMQQHQGGLWIQDTWYLQVVSSHGLLLWLNAINKTIVTATDVRMKRPQSLVAPRSMDRDSYTTLRSFPPLTQCSSPTTFIEQLRDSPTPYLAALVSQDEIGQDVVARDAVSPDVVITPMEPTIISLPRPLSVASKQSEKKHRSATVKIFKWWESISCKPSSQQAL